MNVLEVRNLKTYFNINNALYPAVDGISFYLKEGETLAIIGESGSGKSVTALSIMGLVDEPGKIIHGEILFEGNDLLKLKEKELKNIRGNMISMIYQDPMMTLNPFNKVGIQLEEALLVHGKASKKTSKSMAIELIKAVGISDAEKRFSNYPSQFSGGMRQRLMIAMAISCNPKILIADEPTTALDVTIQSEILELIRDLKKKNNMSIILNTHDLGVVAQMADRVIVMYCGKVMEESSIGNIFNNPLNPYTINLMDCIPRIDKKKDRLNSIEGYVPHPTEYGSGCRFYDRCNRRMDLCNEKIPPLLEIQDNHFVRCWLYNSIEK